MSATDNIFVSESQTDEFELLMESVRPDLYRVNAFRVSGLAVEATAREIARLGEKLKVLEKTGGVLSLGAAGGAGGACGALPLAPPPEPAMIHAAIERLRDPERRLVDEFFWFWPQQSGESRNDEALQLLARGEVAEAEKLWQSQSDSASGGVARHNLAVLHHLTALDLEAQPQPLDEEQRQRLDDAWRNAGRLWATIIVHDGSVWARLTERALELDDPRLTEQTVARLRASLPLALLMINGRLAVSAAESSQPEDAARHQRLIADSGLTPSTQHEALRRAVEPLRARVKNLCKAAETETDADPAHADGATRRLLDQARPLLEVMDQVLPASHPTRVASHDEVALRAADCLIPFGNKTENWRRALELMEAAQPVAASDSAQARIREHLKTLKDNAESGGDWCGEGYYDLPGPVLEVLESAREYYRAKQLDTAIGKLTDLLAGRFVVKVANPHRQLVSQPLAVCLSQRAVGSLNKAMERNNGPLPSLQLMERVAHMRAGLGKSFGGFLSSNPYASLEKNCMMCGRDILFQSHSQITYQGNRYTLCLSCGSGIEREQNERKSDLRAAVTKAAEDLVLAKDLHGVDPAIQQNFDKLREIAAEIGLPLPNPKKLLKRAGLATASDRMALWLQRSRQFGKAIIRVGVGLAVLFLIWVGINLFLYLDYSSDATTRLYHYGIMSRERAMKGLIVTLTLNKSGPRLEERLEVHKRLREFDPEWNRSEAARAAIPDLVDVLEIVSDVGDAKFSAKDTLAVFSAISDVGADAVPLLAPMLRHERRSFRINAARALGAIGPNAQAAIPELRMMSFSGDSEAEKAAEETLAAISRDKAK